MRRQGRQVERWWSRARQGLLGTLLLASACVADSGRPSSWSQDIALLPPFRFEAFDQSRLRELAEREQLVALVGSERRPFQQILRIRDWAAGQWPAGTPDPYPPWDALAVLDWIRSGTTGGFCAQYAQVFLQSLAALGFTARYVEIGSVDNPYAHYVTEVWVPDLRKWVLMDADYNLHFELNGRPLSVLDVHDALLAGRAARLTVVRGTIREGHSSPERWPLKTAELYYYVRYHLKADHLSVPDEPAFDRYNDMVEWLDARVPPWHASPVESPFPKDRLTRLATDDRRPFDAAPEPIEELVAVLPAPVD